MSPSFANRNGPRFLRFTACVKPVSLPKRGWKSSPSKRSRQGPSRVHRREAFGVRRLHRRFRAHGRRTNVRATPSAPKRCGNDRTSKRSASAKPLVRRASVWTCGDFLRQPSIVRNHLSFELRHSFVFRHSSFVIQPSPQPPLELASPSTRQSTNDSRMRPTRAGGGNRMLSWRRLPALTAPARADGRERIGGVCPLNSPANHLPNGPIAAMLFAWEHPA